MPDLRVSVVMATFNGEALLSEQLASIAAQAYQPYELIVGDDGSSDETVEVLEKFAARTPFDVHITRNVERLGYAENFLQGVQRARGDLVAFCDQDDVWFPEKLQVSVPHFQRPDVMALVHNSREVDERLRPLGSRCHTGLVRMLLCADPLHVPHGSQMIFRSELTRTVPIAGRPVSVYGWHPQEHDEWAFFSATALGRVDVLRRPLIFYRRHAGAVGFDHGQLTRTQLIRPDERRDTRLAAAIARADYLEASSQDAPEPTRARLRGASARYRRLVRNLEWQDRLHADGRSMTSRLLRLTGGVLRGSYRGFDGGGLGSLALVRDALGRRSW